MSYSDSYIEFYESHYPRSTKDSTIIFRKKELAENRTKRILQSKYESRSNICSKCNTTFSSITKECLC